MATFDEIKKKALEAADVIADVSVDLYKKAEVKTKELARMAKLQADMAADRTAIKKLYLQIGKTYYETHKMFPAEEFEQNCTEVTTLFDHIDAAKAEIDDIKAKRAEAAAAAAAAKAEAAEDDVSDIEFDVEPAAAPAEEACECCGDAAAPDCCADTPAEEAKTEE